MDLLAGYSDDDDDDQELDQAKAVKDPAPQQQQPQQQPAEPVFKLPPPDFGDDDESKESGPSAMAWSTSHAGGKKRTFGQVAGASIASQGSSPSKAQDKGVTSSPNQAGKDVKIGQTLIPTQLIPPQARGRANISTEDIELSAAQRSAAMRRQQSRDMQQ